MIVRPARDADVPAMVAIYNYYIANTPATFEEEVLSEEDFSTRLAGVAAQRLPWLVAEEQGRLAGYCYASRWKERSAYRYSVEVTVYLDHRHTGGGLGTGLYQALFDQLSERGVHVAIGGITLPNPASVALHEKLGMVKVAEFPEVGYKQGRWLNVGYWQIVFCSTEGAVGQRTQT